MKKGTLKPDYIHLEKEIAEVYTGHSKANPFPVDFRPEWDYELS